MSDAPSDPSDAATGHPYVVESFTEAERAVLARHVTNLDRPVFALRGLPEVAKGALFARYSRSPKSLRRLLLDEFADELPETGEGGATHGRADRLYERVFVEYGDDSVAQLGGAHVAIEQASNLLTKIIEWGRLAAYLEQSTRYIPFDDQPGGRWRYYRDPDVMASPHASAYTDTLDTVFSTYAELLPALRSWLAQHHPREEGVSERAWQRSLGAKACDLLRGLLPAATVSNVGVFASGQAYEQMLLRLRGHELAEARHTGDALLTELREIIPAFLTRVDRPDRGQAWADYQRRTREDVRAVADDLIGEPEPAPAGEVELVDWSPDAEVELVTGALYPHSHLPERQLREQVLDMTGEERARVLRAFVGERGNRRHKPGRALERVWYRFDVLSDYGAFRDLQRHRMLTLDWQELSPRHGYDTPRELVDAGLAAPWHEALERQARLWERLHPDLPRQSQYAVGFAWKLRYSLQLNARAAMQLVELRTQPAGHPSYRRVAQQMHRAIAERAGHHAVADMMRFVDHSDPELERLEAEQRTEARQR